MAEPTPVPRLWRTEQPERRIPGSERTEARKLFLVLLLLLTAAGSLVALLSWARSRPLTALIPVWTTEQSARPIAAPPLLAQDRKALLESGYFADTELVSPTLERSSLERRLRTLQSQRSDEAVLVYLSGNALCDATGRILLIPGDADPDRLAEGIPLRSVLEQLRECPSRHKLLVLDLAWPLTDPRLGLLVDDVAARLPAELDDIPDPYRLTLLSCAPGQTALASEDLGRTVFGHYFEEGLSGWAVAAPGTRVSVKDLARFVQVRVDRWAQRNRGVRQTPLLLGEGADFPITALQHGQPRPHLEPPASADYPTWLRDAWKIREQAWSDEAYRTAPRAVRRLEALLLGLEADWRGGADPAILERDRLPEVTAATERLRQSRTVPQPEPRSLALAVAFGAKPDPAVGEAIREYLRKAAAQPAKPGEAEKAAAEFIESLKARPHLDVASGVFETLASDLTPSPDKIRFLDDLLRAQEPEPRFVETLLVSRLAELARNVGPVDWPAASVRRAVEVVRLGERAASRPHSLAWVLPRLDTAARLRHDGETVLLARGFAPRVDADRLLTQAEEEYRLILDVQDGVEAARAILDEALVFLPSHRAYAEADPDRERRWMSALSATEALSRSLAPTRADGSREGLSGLRSILERETREVRNALTDLSRPLGTVELPRAIEASRRPEAGVAEYRHLDSLLLSPHFSAETRVNLWKASRELGRRLVDDTLALDQEEGQPQGAVAALDDFRTDWDTWTTPQRERAGRRIVASARLLRLAGISLPDALRGVANLEGDRPLPEEDLIPGAKRRAALTQELTASWTIEIRSRLERESDPAILDRLARLYPALDSAPLLDEPDRTSPAVGLRIREATALWTWLADRARHASLESDAAPLHAAAAQAYGRLASRLPGPGVRLRGLTGGLELAPSARSLPYELQVELVDSGEAKSEIDVEILTADNEWLQVQPSQTRLTVAGTEGNRDVAPVSRLPLTVQLADDAEKSQAVPPRGFLVRASVQGKATYLRVPVSLGAVRDRLEAFLSADPKQASAPSTELRLRPAPKTHAYYLYVRNPGPRPRNLLAILVAGDRLLQAPVAVPSQETVRVAFPVPPAPPPPPTPPPAAATPAPAAKPLDPLTGAMVLRLLDTERKNALALSQELKVGVAPPREYVRVSAIRFDPPSPKTKDQNRLEVTLRAAAALTDPPVVAELVIPGDDTGGPPAVLTGTLQGEVPADGAELKLFAEGVPDPGRDQMKVALTVDGVERAFVFRTAYPRRGEPVTPREEDEASLRLFAPPTGVSGGRYAVRVEVDNAPENAALDLALGRPLGSNFEADVNRQRNTTREARIGFGLGSAGELLFDASLRDWTIDLPVAQLRGARTLRGRLLGGDGQAVRTVQLPVLLDDRKPDKVQFVELPAQAKAGTPLTVKAVGKAEVSGIKEVHFFVGAPTNGKPPAGAIAGQPVDPGRTTWSAQLPLPADRKGPLDLGVLFINGVGLGESGKGQIELVDFDPSQAAPGSISGVVQEGDIPQGGLEVVLTDVKGGQKKTKTKEDGTFTFEGLPPGAYKLSSSKAGSGGERKGSAEAKVGPGEKARANIDLFL